MTGKRRWIEKPTFKDSSKKLPTLCVSSSTITTCGLTCLIVFSTSYPRKNREPHEQTQRPESARGVYTYSNSVKGSSIHNFPEAAGGSCLVMWSIRCVLFEQALALDSLCTRQFMQSIRVGFGRGTTDNSSSLASGTESSALAEEGPGRASPPVTRRDVGETPTKHADDNTPFSHWEIEHSTSGPHT